ncbi:MAG TPA: TlpA family protein disulfide reductase [Bryobacteraceae bacterium]|nr:TlpA family protein disulfide reductase [Bryobacteraceae bacterium]
MMKPKHLSNIAAGWIVLVSLGIASLAAGAGIVDSVMTSLSAGSEAGALQQLRAYRSATGVTPEYLEAESWLARAELNSRRYTQAAQFAQETYDLSTGLLKNRPVDREPHLPIALGASIEVQAGVLAAQSRRAEAVAYLEQQEKMYVATSIRVRIHKNLLLLTLEGKPAPALEGAAIPKGQPALVFFWAHWCGDCKEDIPVLTRIKAEFAPQGLRLIFPTQKYGYAAGGVEATPAAELAYIERVRQALYSGLIEGPTIVNETNLTRYGASTIPTFVLIDRQGVVRLYHPGVMQYAELRSAVQRVF